MEDDVCGKIITKFAATARKTYAHKVQNDDYEIKGFEFIKANEVKKSAHKELAFHGFDECVNDTTNAPITKQLTSRRSSIIEFTLSQAKKLLCIMLMIKKLKMLTG